MRVATALPPDLVDQIIGGHIDEGIAHEVNGIAVTSAYSRTYAFSRVDFVVDRATGQVLSRQIFQPQIACPYQAVPGGDCAWEFADDGSMTVARYEGRQISPDPAVVAIAERAANAAEARKKQQIGPNLETPFTLKGNPESALGNLMTDALLESSDADIAMHNVSGGIRGILPAGPLEFGSVYEMFPFDNRVVILELSGYELRKIIAGQARKSRRRAGFSGMRVEVSCHNDVMSVLMTRSSGSRIEDDEQVRVLVNDFLVLGGDDLLTPVIPPGGLDFDDKLPMTRDLLIDWFSRQESLRAEHFLTGDKPKWIVTTDVPKSCALP